MVHIIIKAPIIYFMYIRVVINPMRVFKAKIKKDVRAYFQDLSKKHTNLDFYQNRSGLRKFSPNIVCFQLLPMVAPFWRIFLSDICQKKKKNYYTKFQIISQAKSAYNFIRSQTIKEFFVCLNFSLFIIKSKLFEI